MINTKYFDIILLGVVPPVVAGFLMGNIGTYLVNFLIIITGRKLL